MVSRRMAGAPLVDHLVMRWKIDRFFWSIYQRDVGGFRDHLLFDEIDLAFPFDLRKTYAGVRERRWTGAVQRPNRWSPARISPAIRRRMLYPPLWAYELDSMPAASMCATFPSRLFCRQWQNIILEDGAGPPTFEVVLHQNGGSSSYGSSALRRKVERGHRVAMGSAVCATCIRLV
jgi:hypothetical protein